jgi:hypothetical protein
MTNRTKIETQEVKIVTGKICDICGAETDKHYVFAEVEHQHDQWGNDSIDSLEEFDICSVECFEIALRNSLEIMKPYRRTAEIFGFPYDFAEKLLEKLTGSKGR